MRWTEDLDIQSIRAMPPVIKRRGGQHRNGAPDTEQAAQGTVKDAPHPNGRRLGDLFPKERIIQYLQTGEQPRENGAQVNEDMRRGKEFVPADRPVPGNIPKYPH